MDSCGIPGSSSSKASTSSRSKSVRCNQLCGDYQDCRSVNTFSANIAKSSSSSRNTLSVLPSRIETTIGFSVQVLRFA
ncbi:hypothetical protein LINPERPRIM_LOCUS5764 [Linum perenne]